MSTSGTAYFFHEDDVVDECDINQDGSFGPLVGEAELARINWTGSRVNMRVKIWEDTTMHTPMEDYHVMWFEDTDDDGIYMDDYLLDENWTDSEGIADLECEIAPTHSHAVFISDGGQHLPSMCGELTE